MIPDRLPVEPRNVAGVGTRTDVHNQSDPVLLDQREEHFQRMIGMADREDRSALLGRLVFHLSRRVGEGKPGAGTPTMREKARLIGSDKAEKRRRTAPARSRQAASE